MPHIAVIGAGVTGILTASSLLDRGFRVTVLERARYAAMLTSYGNGGQLSASNAETWNQWGTILKGLRWIAQRNAPLLVNPKPSWHKYSWMTEFVAAIPCFRTNTIETARLAIAARSLLLEKAERHGIEFDCETRGILHIFSNRDALRHAQNINRLLAEAGLNRQCVTPDEIRKIEPALKGDIYAGCYTQSDFTGDVHRFTTGLAKACSRSGADIRYSTEVRSCRVDGDGVIVKIAGRSGQETETFDAIIVCAGVESRAIAASLGDRVNIYPVKGYSITVNLEDAQSREAAPWTSLLDDEAKIVTSRLGENRFRIAGTAEFNGFNLDIREDRIRPLLRWCERHFPKVSTEFSTPWSGLRPMMPDMMPKVGKGRSSRVFYNTGHGHLGWTLSAATAEIVSDEVAKHLQSSPALA